MVSKVRLCQVTIAYFVVEGNEAVIVLRIVRVGGTEDVILKVSTAKFQMAYCVTARHTYLHQEGGGSLKNKRPL